MEGRGHTLKSVDEGSSENDIVAARSSHDDEPTVPGRFPQGYVEPDSSTSFHRRTQNSGPSEPCTHLASTISSMILLKITFTELPLSNHDSRDREILDSRLYH
ncbi:hypothetical protein KSP39_PZI001900 [Platanthera zijinensis]|uniref:Uncharacterized protein n=1 Tax=Platanthera zijinensis TaxID=2320716 RepID=A0AAP0GEH8_9ASPA